MEIYEPLLPTPNTLDGLEPKKIERIVAHNQKARPGRSYLSQNLREVIYHGQRTLDGKPLSLPEASPASLFPKPDEERERKMTATSGRKCYELYESFIRAGSLVKMLAASLLGTKAWYSNKCILIWKVKVTKSKRLLFQLSPSMRHTEGIGYGLLPTHRAGNPGSRPNGKGGKILAEQIAMLPTPDVSDRRSAKSKQQGTSNIVGQQTGLKLQPAFVEWMMGFPEGWTEIPDSKLLEMRLSRKLQKKSLRQ